MIKLIIWSKDRAAQLELLLRSIEKYAPNTFDVSILYTASTSAFLAGYSFFMNKYPTYDWKYESNKSGFQKQTLAMLATESEYVAFSTDDTVLFKELSLKGKDLEQRCSDCGVFSLRLGLNTIAQDIHAGTEQPPLAQYVDEGETISWNWTHYHPLHNYGYPFGLDMHIFHRQMIQEICSEFSFNNTNQLETKLFDYRYLLSPVMKSFKNSVAVNIPANTLSSVTRSGEFFPADLVGLNTKFLEGYRLSLDAISQTDIVGCHQEIPLNLYVESTN